MQTSQRWSPFGRNLIFGVRLAYLLLRRRRRDHPNGCGRADRKRGAGEHHAARDALAIVPAAIHDRLPIKVPPFTINAWAAAGQSYEARGLPKHRTDSVSLFEDDGS